MAATAPEQRWVTSGESSEPPVLSSGDARRARRSRRREQLLVAAGEAFAAGGYYATSMDNISRIAGVSKPILYQHFSNKLDLYLAVLQGHIDVLVHNVRHALRSTTDNEQRVRAAVEAYFDFVDDRTQGYRVVFESDVPSEPSVQWRTAQGIEACVDAIFDLVSHNSGLDNHRARTLAVGLVGASQFAAQYWLEAGRPIPKSEAVEATVTLCWGGVSRLPRRPS